MLAVVVWIALVVWLAVVIWSLSVVKAASDADTPAAEKARQVNVVVISGRRTKPCLVHSGSSGRVRRRGGISDGDGSAPTESTPRWHFLL